MSDYGKGFLNGPLEIVKVLAAHCASFQTWVSAVSVSGAKERIHFIDCAVDDTDPLLIVSYGLSRATRAIGGGGQTAFSPGDGSVYLMFEEAMSGEFQGTVAESEFAFQAKVDSILAELMTLSGVSIDDVDCQGSFDISALEQDPEFPRSSNDKKEKKTYHQAAAILTWGE